jgi:hypothetical protein
MEAIAPILYHRLQQMKSNVKNTPRKTLFEHLNEYANRYQFKVQYVWGDEVPRLILRKKD